MKKDLLIVDGYNMIGAWPCLVRLKRKELLEEARECLLHLLSHYAKYEKLEIICVFDAQFVPGITQSYQKYQLEVIFTKEGQTADAYIEALAGEKNNRLTQVSVATSDAAEQWMVFSKGALRISANELYKRMKRTDKEIKGEIEETKFQRFRRNSPWNTDQLQHLENYMHQLSNHLEHKKKEK